MAHEFQDDIDAIGRLPAVPTILDVVCRTTGMGFAAVARVTSDRWIACSVNDQIKFGLTPGGELKVETTICNEIRQSGEHVVIDHVSENAAYRAHHTPAQYGFQSYISMPIILRDGSFFGTLCAIDPQPARLETPEIIGMFKLFADLIASELDYDARLRESEALLLNEQEVGKLREQFIAVLGHDLRNPLASISGASRLLSREVSSDLGKSVIQMMQASVNRMAGLIDNVMDFARARLGGGVALQLVANDMEAILMQVVSEMRTTHPERRIETDFSCAGPVMCDRGRIARLASNLLGNAITYGNPNEHVVVSAMTTDGTFEFSISNTGDEIPAASLPGLFQPYARGAHSKDQQGLGLGLYISSEIAKAHGGTLEAASSPVETRFTFRMATG